MRSRDGLGHRLSGSRTFVQSNGQGEDEGHGRWCKGSPGPCLHAEIRKLLLTGGLSGQKEVYSEEEQGPR